LFAEGGFPRYVAKSNIAFYAPLWYKSYMKVSAFVCVLALPALAQFSPEEMLKPYVYTNETGETFPYRMSAPQFPEAGRRYPLVLFLHGSGECGTDNLRHIQTGLPKLMTVLLKQPEPVIVVAPQCQSGNWWVRRLAFDEKYAAPQSPSASLEVALTLCRSLVASGLADSNRLYITGLSLGGFGTWDAIQREPTMFAAAVPLCGGGDIRRVRAINRLPIWVFHGRMDKNVPVACSRRMVEALRQAGSHAVQYTEYPSADHVIWDTVYADPALVDWLLKQTRVQKPWWRFW
jgi:predicted peptidase